MTTATADPKNLGEVGDEANREQRKHWNELSGPRWVTM